MFVPITSEVTIEKGMVLKEISTAKLFEVGARLTAKEEVLGDDPWELIELSPGSADRRILAVHYENLAGKYFAEVNE